MKSVLKKISVVLIATFILTSCGHSVCDCLDNAKKGAGADMGMAKKCAEKYTMEDVQAADCK